MDSTTIPFTIQLPTDMPFAFRLQALLDHLSADPDRQTQAAWRPLSAGPAAVHCGAGATRRTEHRRDVTLHEDASQVRRGHAPQVLAVLNNTVIGLMPQSGAQNLVAVQRAFAHAFDRILVFQNAM